MFEEAQLTFNNLNSKFLKKIYLILLLIFLESILFLTFLVFLFIGKSLLLIVNFFKKNLKKYVLQAFFLVRQMRVCVVCLNIVAVLYIHACTKTKSLTFFQH